MIAKLKNSAHITPETLHAMAHSVDHAATLLRQHMHKKLSGAVELQGGSVQWWLSVISPQAAGKDLQPSWKLRLSRQC